MTAATTTRPTETTRRADAMRRIRRVAREVAHRAGRTVGDVHDDLLQEIAWQGLRYEREGGVDLRIERARCRVWDRIEADRLRAERDGGGL